MNIKKEVEVLLSQIYKSYTQIGIVRSVFSAGSEPEPLLSEELHKLTAELEVLLLQCRYLDEYCYINSGPLEQRPYNKHWSDTGITGFVETDENGWLHIMLNTLLPHSKYQSSPYLKDTLVRLLSGYQIRGGELPFYEKALLVIDEHCQIDKRRVLDQDNKNWKNLPADMAGSFHSQVLSPAGIALLDKLGLLMVTRNGQSIRLRERGWRLLRYLGFEYHKDNRYRSDYGRRVETARILLTYWRAGFNVFSESLNDLGKQGGMSFLSSMEARRNIAAGGRGTAGDLWGGAVFWGLARHRNTISSCYYVSGHEDMLLNYRNENNLLDKAASILGGHKAMLLAGSGYTGLARALRNTGHASVSDRTTFAGIARDCLHPVHLLECSDTGAMQLLITAQENYRKRLADTALKASQPPPVGIQAADGALIIPGKPVIPWVLAIDMDVIRIGRFLRQSISSGLGEPLVVCLPGQLEALKLLCRDTPAKIAAVTNENLLNAFGALTLYEPPQMAYTDQKGGMLDASDLPVD